MPDKPAHTSSGRLIHVAIPVYNGGDTIGEAIESLLAQSYPHWRLTVHDNSSTDNTREAVARFTDERITLVKHAAHVPIWASWNRCLREIQGEFFQLLCADDKLHPECFSEKMKLAAMPQHYDVMLFCSNRRLLSKSGRPLFTIGYAKRGDNNTAAGIFTLADIMQKAHKTLNPLGDPGIGLARAAAVSGARFTANYPFFVDMELWLHVLQQGRMLHLPQTLSYFRVRGAALSGSRFFRNFRDSIVFYQQRVKPFYLRQRLRYCAGYGYIIARSLAREALYFLNK